MNVSGKLNYNKVALCLMRDLFLIYLKLQKWNVSSNAKKSLWFAEFLMFELLCTQGKKKISL